MDGRQAIARVRELASLAKKSYFVYLIKENPLVLVGIALGIVLLVFFWWLVIGIGLLLAVFAIALRLLFTGPSLKEFLRKKSILLKEIRLLESKYMKREINKEDFVKVFRKKQSELISLEALIDKGFNKERLPMNDKRFSEVAAKKKACCRGTA